MKKGFTLIELLAVIVILAIIALISTPIVLDVIEQSNIKAKFIDQSMVTKATETYISTENIVNLNNVGDTATLDISALKGSGYLKNCECDGYVLITKLENTFDINPQLNCSNNITNITEDSLVSYWKLNNNSFDHSPTNNHGIVHNALFEENHLHFDGSEDYVELGLDSTPKTIYTKSVWIRTNSSSAANVFSSSAYEVLYLSGGRIIVSNTWGSPQFGDEANFYDNKWHNIVVTYDGTTGIIYFDGELLTSGPLNNINTGIQVYLGRYSTGNWYRGDIKEVKVYSRVLNEDEIKEKYLIDKQMLAK